MGLNGMSLVILTPSLCTYIDIGTDEDIAI
jgi:hypothetical protein